jgi:beta-lactamase class A
MVIVSDNTATNMLIDRVGGIERVNETMRALDVPSIVLHNRVDFEILRHDARLFGEASPRDLANLLAGMARGEVVDADSSAEMLQIMSRQQYLDQAPRYLDFNPYAVDFPWIGDQVLTVACKTGFMRGGVRVDAGLISLPSDVEIAYCIATNGSRDGSFGPEHEGQVVNGLVGRLLVEYWWEGAAPPPILDTPYASILE